MNDFIDSIVSFIRTASVTSTRQKYKRNYRPALNCRHVIIIVMLLILPLSVSYGAEKDQRFVTEEDKFTGTRLTYYYSAPVGSESSWLVFDILEMQDYLALRINFEIFGNEWFFGNLCNFLITDEDGTEYRISVPCQQFLPQTVRYNTEMENISGRTRLHENYIVLLITGDEETDVLSHEDLEKIIHARGIEVRVDGDSKQVFPNISLEGLRLIAWKYSEMIGLEIEEPVIDDAKSVNNDSGVSNEVEQIGE